MRCPHSANLHSLLPLNLITPGSSSLSPKTLGDYFSISLLHPPCAPTQPSNTLSRLAPKPQTTTQLRVWAMSQLLFKTRQSTMEQKHSFITHSALDTSG
ncbi:hypothetical protein BDW69DRAFT_126108 [Aspergillus filifer]